jgi:hypothetical protein
MKFLVLSVAAFVIGALSLPSCDPILYARATAPLIAPVDSVCLKNVLTKRLGSPSMHSFVERRTRRTDAALWLYYGHASFTQIYSDSGSAALTAAEPVASGLQALFWPPRTTQDSVSRYLGREILAARDSCGGRPQPGRPELTVGRERPNKRLKLAARVGY